MHIRDLPQEALARLLELGDIAERLVAEADAAEAALKEARRILNDLKPTGTPADRELRALQEKTTREFDATLKAVPAARARATAVVAVLNRAKRWVEGLPDGSVLELAPKLVLNGQTSFAVGARQHAIADEILKLRSALVDPRQLFAAQVDELAARAAPDITEAGEVRRSEAVSNFATGAEAMAAYLHRDLLIDKWVQRYEARWGKPLTVAQRDERIAMLERERDELWWVEAALMEADPEVVCSPSVPSRIVLGVNVVERRTQLAS